MDTIIGLVAPLLPVLAPFILNSIVGLFKQLVGSQALAVMAGKNSLLRSFLGVLAVGGVLAGNALYGTPVDYTSLGDMVRAAGEAFMLFAASHGSYTLFFKQPSA